MGAYIGTIYVNHIENNSVKIAFCNLLLKVRACKKLNQDEELNNATEDNGVNNCEGLYVAAIVY